MSNIEKEESQKIWLARFINLATMISGWSKDPSTKVGAVIVDKDNRIISTGYNGLPKGVEDTHERIHNREIKLTMVVHAEENAILFSKCDLSDKILFVTMPPCSHCACKIIQSGIKTVYSYQNKNPKWDESIKISKQLFEESGVKFFELNDEGHVIEKDNNN